MAAIGWSGLWRLGVLCLIVAAPSLGLAQDDPAADRAQAFQAVEGAVKEDIPGAPLMLAAYAIMWTVSFAYGFRLLKLQARAQQDIERLERTLSQGGERATEQG